MLSILVLVNIYMKFNLLTNEIFMNLFQKIKKDKRKFCKIKPMSVC